MTGVNGRIAASVGTADSYVSFPILYLFIFRKTLVAKIRIIFSDQAHSSLKKRGFAKIQNNDEPSTPTGVELQVTAHDTMCGSKCLPNPRPQRRSNLSTDYMVRPRWGRMYRSHLAIRKSLTLRLTEVRPFSRSVCTPLFYVKCRCNITSQVIEQFYQDLRDTELIYLLHSPNCSMAGRPTSCRHWFTRDASKSGARFPLPSI